MKKLILFIHGLGGSRDTWGDFPTLIQEDEEIDKELYDFVYYEYGTSILTVKAALPVVGMIGKFFDVAHATAVATGVTTVLEDSLKIEEIARLLDVELTLRYSKYKDIYIVSHSMGGLVAQKYIVDVLNHSKNLRVKKLMLYDVPNHGSSLAKIATIYKHKQIEQLGKNSDFIGELNRRSELKKIPKLIDTKYVICRNGSVVDTPSASAGYTEGFIELNETHKSIVKPKDKEAHTYLIFKDFIMGDACDEACQFIKDIFDNLSNEIFILLHQRHTHVSPIISEIQTLGRNRFKEHFYHFVTPQTSKAKYYQKLGECIGKRIKNATEFQEAMGEIAQKNKVLLYINNFEDNEESRALELSTALRNLKNNYPNFHAILIGQEKLANMTYRGDATLSPLNNAMKKIFPNNATLEMSNITHLIHALEEYDKPIVEAYIAEDNIGYFDISDTLKMKLFWCNLINKKEHDKLYWKDENTRNIVKELLQ